MLLSIEVILLFGSILKAILNVKFYRNLFTTNSNNDLIINITFLQDLQKLHEINYGRSKPISKKKTRIEYTNALNIVLTESSNQKD